MEADEVSSVAPRVASVQHRHRMIKEEDEAEGGGESCVPVLQHLQSDNEAKMAFQSSVVTQPLSPTQPYSAAATQPYSAATKENSQVLAQIRHDGAKLRRDLGHRSGNAAFQDGNDEVASV